MAAGSPLTAATDQTLAKVIRVTGSATGQRPGQVGAEPLQAGAMLPLGSVINTDIGAEVELQPFAGALASIRAGSIVFIDTLGVERDGAGVITRQSAGLILRTGTLVSTLDPARKKITSYSVGTDRGMATATGTVFAVTATQTATTVATLAGTVSLTSSKGGPGINIDVSTGRAVVLTDDRESPPTTLAALVQAEAAAGTAGQENSITRAIAQTVATVTNAVANNAIIAVTQGATNENTAMSLLVAVLKAAAQANPAEAATYTQLAVAALSAPGSAVSANNYAVAVAALTEAAVQGVVQTLIAQPEGSDAARETAGEIMAAVRTTVNESGRSISERSLSNAAQSGALVGTSNANRDGGTTFTSPLATPSMLTSTPIVPLDVTVVSPSNGEVG